MAEQRLSPGPFTYYPALERVRRYIHTHLSERITLADAARAAHLERKYFSSFFHAKVGMTFREWLWHTRVGYALNLIDTKRISVTEAAYASGFGSLRSFERAFLKVLRLTPARYRRATETRIANFVAPNAIDAEPFAARVAKLRRPAEEKRRKR